MDLLSDADLVGKSGSAAKLSVGPHAAVGIFFSSSWCPDCVPFVAKLATMYEEINDEEDSKKFEVVFVSSDRDAGSMLSYMNAKHADWLAVAFDSPIRSELKQKYGACAGSEQASAGVTDRRRGIPTLVIVKPDGTEVCDGTNEVNKYAGGALPKKWMQP